MASYRVRPYDPDRDIDACARVQVSAFGHNHWPFWQKAHSRLARDFVAFMAGLGNLNLVAEDMESGRVSGFVFAASPLNSRSLLNASGKIIKLLGFGMIGLPGWKIIAFRHARRFISAMSRLMREHPSYDPHTEILEFAVHEEAQGKGAGRMLMDSAVRELARRGAKQVVLMTDSTMSWRFYERYGYKRVRDVDFGNAYELATGSLSEHGYSYELDIPDKMNALQREGRAA